MWKKQCSFLLVLGVFLFLFSENRILLFGQTSSSSALEQAAYKTLEIRYNWTLKLSNPLSLENLSLSSTPYFLVTKNHGDIVSVEYKNAKGDPSVFSLDDVYRINFFRAQLDYVPGKKSPPWRISKMTIFDPMGLPIGYVEYFWDNKKIEGRDGNIRSCTLFRYSYVYPRGFFPLEKRSFIFGGGALGNDIKEIRRTNMQTKQLIEEAFYKGGELVTQKFYNDSAQLFFSHSFEYSFGKLKTQTLISGKGVKMEARE